MGFGYGNGTYHGSKVAHDSEGNRVAQVFSNDMVAHVWNSQSQDFGRSNNGNFYFEGRAIYSYGSHFLVGFIMPDGAALLNADSYSVSTSQHQGDASSAARNRPRYNAPNLTDIRDSLEAFARGFSSADAKRRHKAAVREYLTANAAKLARHGRDSYRWQAEQGEGEPADNAGLYIATAFGLARSWPAIKREAERRKAKAERDAAKAKADEAKRKALRLADATDSEFRAMTRLDSGWHGDNRGKLERLKRELWHAKRYAKAHGFSNRRMATIRERERRVVAILADFESRNAVANARRELREDIAAIRASLRRLEEIGEPSTANDMTRAFREFDSLARAAGRIKSSPRLPFVSRRRLARLAEHAAERSNHWQERQRATQAAEWEAEQAARLLAAEEARRAWLAGEIASLPRSFDSEHGGAALRVYGKELQTSHGAQVPLEHAIKAFRFLKLIRQRGEEWQRNGKTIRVGHFQIDRIEPSGDFKAGCHDIRWPETERVAAALGLLEEPASAEAEERNAA